jgi:hypothetical protein
VNVTSLNSSSSSPPLVWTCKKEEEVIYEVRYDLILVTIYNIDALILKGFERKV